MLRLKSLLVPIVTLVVGQSALAATVIGSHRNSGVSLDPERYTAVSKSGLFAAGVRQLQGEYQKALLVRLGPGPTPVFNITWPMDGEGSLADVEEIVIDGRTDAIVCGRLGFGGYIARINGDTGAIVWENRYISEFGSELSALLINAQGIYATGRIAGEFDNDFLTMRLDPATGLRTWERRWESDTGGATGIATDLGYNIFVVGTGTVAGKTAKQLIVVKYSLAGTYLGSGSFGTNYPGQDPYGGTIACDGVNVLVSGTLYNGATRGRDTATACFNNSVVLKWSKLEDMDSDEDFAWRAAFDQAGNAYTLAEAHGAQDRWLTRIYSYAPNGTPRFVYEDGPVGYYTSAFDFVVLPSGRCYYAGFSNGIQGNTFYIGGMENGLNLWRVKQGEGEGYGIASGNGVVTAVGFAPVPPSGSFDNDPYCVTVREKLTPVDDTYLVREGEQLSVPASIGVLKNDLFNQGPGTVTLFQQATHGTAEVDPDGGFRYTPNSGYRGTDTFQYRWTYGSDVAVGTVNLNVIMNVKSINFDTTTMTGIGTVNGWLDMTSPAGLDVNVNIVSNSPLLVLSNPFVYVQPGLSFGTFYVKPKMVTTTQNVVVSAYYKGLVRSRTVTLRPLRPTVLTMTPNPVWGGSAAQGRVGLDGLAGEGGQSVELAENSSFVTVPASVNVPMSASAVNFSVTTLNPSSTQTVTLTGRIGAYTVTRVFLLNRVCAQSLTLQPSSVTGGGSSTGTVTLNGPAPPGGSTVSIFDSSVYVTPPATVAIPAGATSGSFSIQTAAVSFTVNCSVRATYNGATGSATLTVTP